MINLEQLFKWAYKVGVSLKKEDSKYVEALIFDLRAEKTPGRFFEKLAIRIADFNKRLGTEITVYSDLLKKEMRGDYFYYLKFAILAGLLNSLSGKGEKNN